MAWIGGRLLTSENPRELRFCLTASTNGASWMTIFPSFTPTTLDWPDRTFTSVWCAKVLTWIQMRANRGLVTILCTWVWTYPATALASDGPNDFSSPPTRVRPLLFSAAAAWLA